MRRPNKKEEYLGMFLLMCMILGLLLLVPFAITTKAITIVLLVLGIIVFLVAFISILVALDTDMDEDGDIVKLPSVELGFAFDSNKEKMYHAALSEIQTIALYESMNDYELNKVEIYRLATEALEYKRSKIND